MGTGNLCREADTRVPVPMCERIYHFLRNRQKSVVVFYNLIKFYDGIRTRRMKGTKRLYENDQNFTEVFHACALDGTHQAQHHICNAVQMLMAVMK